MRNGNDNLKPDGTEGAVTDEQNLEDTPQETAGAGVDRGKLVKSEEIKRSEILNKTPLRIGIKSKYLGEFGEPEYLVISPFSSKVISVDTKEDFDYHHWEREDLIQIQDVEDRSDENLTALGYGVGCGVWLVIYLAVALLVPLLRASIYTWGIFAVLLVIGVIMVAYNSGGFKDFKGNLMRLGRGFLRVINLVLLLFVVLGLGVGLFYLFSGGRDWITTGKFPIEGLGRVIQYLFLTIATLLPALMYFLFNRQRREKVQENFIREVLRLDPGIRTITEAEAKYLSQIQATFGTAHTSAFIFSSGLPILLSTLLIFMGWLLVLQPFTTSSPINSAQLETLLLPRPTAISFAFLGAYFYAINLVFRGYIRADLTPKTYTNIILRLLLAIILAWTLSALPVFDPSGDVEGGGFSTGLLYLLAFFIGVFPETGMAVLRDLARNPFFTRMFPRLEEEHPLTRLEGINLYDRSRFMEEGIENVENLAHHNLIELMLSTRISTNRLVDLFDQAILYIHLGLDPDAITETRKQLLDYGIRTATDLEAAYQSAKNRMNGDLEKLLGLLDDPEVQPAPLSRLQTILDTLQDDDWMTYLRNWRELSQRIAKTYTLKGMVLEPLEASVEEAMMKADLR